MDKVTQASTIANKIKSKEGESDDDEVNFEENKITPRRRDSRIQGLKDVE